MSDAASLSAADNPLGWERQDVQGISVFRFHNARILSDRSVQELGDRFTAFLSSLDGPPRVVISFQGVTFLSSAALGKLILLQRKVKERGGELKLCDIHPPNLEVFRVAHLNDYFMIYPDLNSALGAFA